MLHEERFHTLREVASRVLVLYPTAAGEERGFPSAKQVHTDVRNRLHGGKAQKPTHVAISGKKIERGYAVMQYQSS